MVGVIVVTLYAACETGGGEPLVEKLLKYYSVKYPKAFAIKWEFSKRYPTVWFDLRDIIWGLIRFVRERKFDPLRYDHLEMKDNRSRQKGDFTWLVPGHVLALATPQSNIPYVDEKSSFKGIL